MLCTSPYGTHFSGHGRGRRILLRPYFVFEVIYHALIDIRDLTFAYPGSYDNVFEHLSLQLDTHWRLGLVGRNGRGKTTLLRLLQRQYEYDGAISVPVPP